MSALFQYSKRYTMFSNLQIVSQGLNTIYPDLSIKTFRYTDHRFAAIIEDSLVLIFDYGHSFLQKDDDWNELMVIECTPNLLELKFNIAAFRNFLVSHYLFEENLVTRYVKYATSDSYWWSDPPLELWVMDHMPELEVRERIAAWPGIPYHFIILELDDCMGKTAYAVAYTRQETRQYVLKLCESWIKDGKIHSNAINNGYVERNINSAFSSWKGMKRQERLEEHFRYHHIDMNAKRLEDVYGIQTAILKNAQDGKYDHIEKSTFLKPVNKWISEELVYRLTKKIYKHYHVIYQHRPYFLHSQRGGQMSYDIYIAELKTAIEYQGKQHFEPVDFFGGEIAFRSLQERDKEKRFLSKENGINLVYINYWEEITSALIKERVGYTDNFPETEKEHQ